MPSSYTSNLRLTLPATGENSGTWGNLVNSGITNLVDSAIAGTANISLPDSDYVLTVANGVADESRSMFINLTGSLTGTRSVICPSVSKLYFVYNNTSGGNSIIFRTSAGAGITVENGTRVALYCNGTNVLNAFDQPTFLQAGTGAVKRSYQNKMREIISVEDFGAVGDGVTDDSAAFQRAVNYAESLIGPSGFDAVGVEIELGPKKYLLNTTVNISLGGVGFRGPLGRGAMVEGNNILFNVGDPTNTQRIRFVSFENVHFYCNVVNGTTAGLRLYRTTQTQIERCNFTNWNVAVDGYRASTLHMDRCYFANGIRNVQGQAFIRFQGLDESLFPTPTVTATGGGIHITDCEFDGGSIDMLYGIEVRSADGLYLTQCHWTDCVYTLGLVPEGTPANHVITNIQVNGCFFDGPSRLTSDPKNILIGGTVRRTITMASGATRRSLYQKISVIGGQLRGDDYADRCAVIQVTDADGWWNNGDQRLQNILFSGVIFGQARNTAIQIYGADSTPANTYVEPYGVVIDGCTFWSNGIANPSGIGICIQSQSENVVVTNNSFLPNSGNSDYIVSIVTTDAGDDEGPGSAIISSNDFSRTTGFLVRPLNVSVGALGSNVIQANNLYPGGGTRIDEVYKLTTTNATPTTIWTYLIPEGVAGIVNARIAGSTVNGSRRVAYEFEVGFGRNTTTSSLSTGTTNWTNTLSWNPDSLATAPTATLVGNTLTVTVTGAASTSIDWDCHIDLVRSR